MTTGATATGRSADPRDRLRALLAAVGGSTPSRRRAWLGYGLYTLALFLVCFLATFPHDLLLRRVLSEATAGTPVRVEAGRGSLGWNLTYAIDGLRIRARGEAEGEPFLAAEALRVSPSRLGLLRGTPYPIGIDATLYGGRLQGTIDPRPERLRVDANLSGVDLGRYAGLGPWLEGGVRGRLEGAVALDGGGRGLAAAAGSVELRIAGLTLEGAKVRGITVPDLHFSDVHVKGTVKNGRLELGDIAADGQEITLQGEGGVLLREPLGTSPMSLDLTITPTAAAPDGLKLAINMLPGAKAEGGARRITLVGTVGRPSPR
ncbi:MAG: type II secretion system protein GspN [Deltaproteobacteria bacterium]|nr:type II secretion system protein GspN [Deltaproteobacteria bacterium]